ncbi:MAG: AmmeMemoRadiSam system protein B [Endomicrobiia bacterium]
MRQPAVSGQFYPSDKESLQKTIQTFLSNVPSFIKESAPSEIYGIIVPHAGYIFSGQVAGYGFKILEGKNYDTVILIGQSHHYYLSKAVLFDGDGFSTPLGNVLTDKEFISKLSKKSEIFEINNHAHIPEHSLEVELPFLQVVLKNKFKIVPILVSSFSIEKCKEIAESIVSIINTFPNKKFLFVISTDMSHYPKYEDANLVDREALKTLEKFDPELLKKTNDSILSKGYKNLSCVFCGEQAVLTGMYATKILGADTAKVLYYANSGDVPRYGDMSRVVGYCAVAFGVSKEKILQKKEAEKMPEFSISEKNQKILLELARRTIKEYLGSKKIPPFETDDPELKAPSAVFVTLNKFHNLRGCIGTTVPQLPLYQAVQQMAIASAFEDYRFSPVSESELKDIKIEISVLSPLKKVKSADEIKPNVHGVVVRRGGRSGLFLPQVWEHFSKKEDFLNELCYQKAGLNPDAWRDPSTELYIFTVFAFEEE